ncbi:hydrolase [Leptospira ognonensis]|uniref:Hydrolase n=1 Tax=Leptospira ognonensis TaxID=2484945 RepID=A0A4R9KC89_9LEPT|nr:alpha/beta hydrolase [Leptospira ognonensis]TGL62712.1 hydrolase [Leptospira ognonensis]
MPELNDSTLAVVSLLYFTILFVVYYFHKVVSKPAVHFQRNEINCSLLSNFSILKENYFPTLWCFNRHLMLILLLYRDYRSKPYIYDKIEELRMKDGGITGLVWTGLAPEDSKLAKPIVVIFHTISGDEQDVKNTLHHIKTTLDCIVVVCIRRGHGHLPLSTPVINTMGSTSDLKEQLAHIRKRFPNSILFGVGISAGSGLLARYLGESGSSSVFRAAVAISPAYDIEKAFHRIHPMYSKLMGQRLIDYFLERHYESLSQLPGYLHVSESKSIGEFQDRLHLLAGFESRKEYYAESNPINVVKNIETSLLILNSKDDPICVDLNVIENLHWLESLPNTILVRTKRGSHIAFYEGIKARSWSDRLICEYFSLFLA